jgi:hypothetical protein
MTKKFILTDIMGSHNSHLIKEYLKSSLEPINCTNSFYKLHNFNLKKIFKTFCNNKS